MRVGLMCAWLLLLLCLPAASRAASAFQPGFKTVGVWLEEKNLRLDINIWYPAVRKPFDVTYGAWELHVARNGREAEGRFPLLLLSHDSSGTRFSHHETAAWLAQSGFVVAAPTHNNDNTHNMPQLFTLRQLLERVEELRATLDVLTTHTELHGRIDLERVGVVGFGVGGTAALMLGGALPQAAGWREYCLRAGGGDLYCTSWAAPRMQKLVESLPLQKSPADTRVKAVAAVAPAYGMLFNKHGLQWVYPPVLLIKAGNDTVNREPWHADAVRRLLPNAPYFSVIDGVDAETLMSACPPALAKDIPELCGRGGAAERRRAHRELDAALTRFFLQTLGGIEPLPHIPAPPDLSPPPPTEVKKQPSPEKKKVRGNKRKSS